MPLIQVPIDKMTSTTLLLVLLLLPLLAAKTLHNTQAVDLLVSQQRRFKGFETEVAALVLDVAERDDGHAAA